jgi:hypothetical protein
MEGDMEKVLSDFQILLAAVATKFTLHLSPAVEAIGFSPILLVAHKSRSLQGDKGRRKGGIEQGSIDVKILNANNEY